MNSYINTLNVQYISRHDSDIIHFLLQSEDYMDILKVDIAIKDSNRLSFQTQWNKELPGQILLWLKKKVASLKDLKDTVTYFITALYNEISNKYEKLESTIDHCLKELPEILKLIVEKAEELINSIKFQDLGKFSSWISKVYSDAVNSSILNEIAEQAEKTRRIIEDYYKTVEAKAKDIFAEMTLEQLIEDTQAWIESTMTRLEVLMNQIIETLKDAKNIQPYVRLNNTELNIDIPIPFIRDFFSRMISHPCTKTLSS